jgi:signal transduction histidine kinase
VISLLSSARQEVGAGRARAAEALLKRAETKVSEVAALTSEHASEATIFRVLASLGLEQAAFIHEVYSISVLAQGVAKALEELALAAPNSGLRNKLKAAASDVRDLRERLRRNAVYLTDMTGIEGRNRRSRQLLLERFERIVPLFAGSISRRGLRIDNKLAEKIRTPPMFPAEVSAIFSNILSNAIKFSEDKGRILILSSVTDDDIIIRMENTGTRVDLDKAQQWFEPFRSSTAEVDNVLGQGMGLGLTITRSLIEEYGGSIAFVEPHAGFATAIEVRLPNK